MKFKMLECVVLDKDLPEHSLRKGDLGTVVEIYGREGVEVEFVAPSGETRAVLALPARDLRKVKDSDVLAVRPSS